MIRYYGEKSCNWNAERAASRLRIALPCIGKIASIAVVDKTFRVIARRHATHLEYRSAADASTTIRNVGNDEVSEGRLADEDEASRRNHRQW